MLADKAMNESTPILGLLIVENHVQPGYLTL